MRMHTLVTAGLLCIFATQAFAAGPTPAQIDALIAKTASAPEEQNPDGTWIENEDAAELHYALVHGDVSDAQWTRLLETSNIITVRERWPIETPLIVRTTCPDWVGPAGSITIQPRLPDARKIVLFSLHGRPNDQAMSIRINQAEATVGVPPLGESNVMFDIQVSMRAQPSKAHPRAGVIYSKQVIHKETITKRIVVSDTPADMMKPVISPELEKAIRESLILSRPSNAHGLGNVSVGAHLTPECLAFSTTLALCVLLEVVDDEGHIQQRSELDFNDDGHQQGKYFYLWVGSAFTLPTPDKASLWKVRVRGDVDAAFKDARFDSYWAGEFTIPYNEVVAEE